MFADGHCPGKKTAPVKIELAAHFKAPALSGLKAMSEGKSWADLSPFEQGALMNLVETLSNGEETLWPKAPSPQEQPTDQTEELHL